MIMSSCIARQFSARTIATVCFVCLNLFAGAWAPLALAEDRHENEPDSELTLYAGAVSTHRFGQVTSVVIGNDELLSATLLDNNDLLLMPKAPGTTDVLIRTLEHGQQLIKLRIMPAQVYNDADLVQEIIVQYPQVSMRRSGDANILTGTVTQDEYEQFQRVVQGFPKTISLVKPKLSVQIEDVVAMDIKILEVNKQYQKNVGIRWQDTGPGPAIGAVTNLIPSNRFGVVSDVGNSRQELLEIVGTVGPAARGLYGYMGFSTLLGSELQLLQENGAARILAEPTLSTLNGKPATFKVGGELPVAILNQFGQPVVEFREYGILLEINPIVDDALNIRSEIRAEISSVDFSTQVNGIPGLLKRQTKSTINARPGDTIIISGLVDAKDNRVVDKFPWLGDIPILGALFRSSDFQQQRTELLMLVTPRIQRPNTPISEHLRIEQKKLSRVLRSSNDLDRQLVE